MWIHILTTLYEPNQYMRWNTWWFFGGSEKTRKSALKTQKCKTHPMVRYETTRLTHSHRDFLNAWLLWSTPGICTSNGTYQVQIENPCALSQLSGAETPAHQRGLKRSRWKHRRMNELKTVVLSLRSSTDLLEKKTWIVILVTVWWIVMGKSCFFCQRERKIMMEKQVWLFPSQKRVLTVIIIIINIL